MVAAFFLDISQLSFVLSPSNTYPNSMIVLCLVLDERSDLGPLLYLAEEVFLLGLHSQPLMAKLLPRTTNLYAPVSIYLSLNNLMSSDTTHGPISISRPFIPKLRMQKKKKRKKSWSGVVIGITFLSLPMKLPSSFSRRLQPPQLTRLPSSPYTDYNRLNDWRVPSNSQAQGSIFM